MDSTQVGILISLKTAGFSALSGNISSLSKLSAGLEKVGKNVTGLNEKIAKIGAFKTKIDTNLGKISGELGKWQSSLATAASFAVPVKLAVDFESSMAEVKKYVDFKSEDEIKILGEQIKQLSRELGVNANELAQISASGGQLGLDSSKIADFTKLVSKMGVAFDMSGKDAGDAIALTMNNLKLGIDEIATLGDKINYLDDKMSMVKARDIINVIGRTAGSGSILGLKGDKISALASSFLSLGKAPEVASTAMNSLFNKLANIDGQDEKFKKALQSIGMDANYLKVAMARDASGGLDMFLNTLAKVDKKAQMGVLTNLFGTQFADDMGSLVNAIGQYNQAVNLVNDKGAIGSTDEAMKAKLATTKSGLERLTQSFITLGVTIGEAFLPTLNLIISGLSKVANSIIAFTKAYPNFSKALFGIAGGMLAIITVAPMLKILWWSLNMAWQQVKILGTGISFLNSVFKLKYLSTLKLNAAYLITAARMKATAAATWIANTAGKAWAATMAAVRGASLAAAAGIKIMRLALISTGIGALVVALGAGAAWIIENWDKVKAFFENIWESVKPYWKATSNFFSSIFDSVVEWWRSIFGGFFDWISEKFQWVVDTVSSIGDALGAATDWTKDALGIGDGKESNWYNPFSWFNDEEPQSAPIKAKEVLSAATKPQTTYQAKAAGLNGSVNISFNGDFLLNSNNGKFDLESFKAQITRGVKEALRRDEFNSANTEIREQR
jgi:phage tail tape measure protein, TP901 family|uniref:Minor tail protein n=1 Tax=Myoviridae sp. ctJHU2 TaxID=2823540 RepID=A0A8S5LEP5_9CAUD|nr:MAG TPA: minor tail protein [Myoviridae sp. ctJHU2]